MSSSVPLLDPHRVDATYCEAVNPNTPRWRARGLATWLISRCWEHLSVYQMQALRALLDGTRPTDEDSSPPPAGAPRTRPRNTQR